MSLFTSFRILATASVLACSALAVQAQSHGNKEAVQYQRGSAAHLEQLKEKLNLTANQQGAWEQYQTAIQSTEHARGAREDKKNLTEEQKSARRVQGEAHKQAKQEARNTLHAQLSPEQQNIFDAAGKNGKSQRSGKNHSE